MSLVGLERQPRLLEAAVRDLSRPRHPRAVVRRLAEVSPQLVAEAERRRGDEAAELVHLDLERLVGGEGGGELPDQRPRLASLAGLDREPGTFAERSPERLRIADLAGAGKHDLAACSSASRRAPRAAKRGREHGARADLHVLGRALVLEERRRTRDRRIPGTGRVVVNRALGQQPLLVVASEATCDFDPLAMQLGRAAEVADGAEDRREIQVRARGEVRVCLQALVDRELQVANRGLRVAVVGMTQTEVDPGVEDLLGRAELLREREDALSLLERGVPRSRAAARASSGRESAPSSRVSGRPAMSSIARS